MEKDLNMRLKSICKLIPNNETLSSDGTPFNYPKCLMSATIVKSLLEASQKLRALLGHLN